MLTSQGKRAAVAESELDEWAARLAAKLNRIADLPNVYETIDGPDTVVEHGSKMRCDNCGGLVSDHERYWEFCVYE